MSAKKTWTAPAVEELGVEKTLGGTQPNVRENFFEAGPLAGQVNPNGGTIPIP
jgi:hypothetical protein